MLDEEFLEQIQVIVAGCSHVDIQKAVFSATLPANAEKIAMGMLRNPIRVVVGLKCVLFPISFSCFSHLAQRYSAASHRPVIYIRRR
jgi:ATP-dependent RNA helicase DDX52/ROK1